MKSRRVLVSLSVILLLATLLPLGVSANSPPPSYSYTFHLDDLPSNTAYVDLLIPLAENDDAYSPLVSENLPDTFPANAQIVAYNEDGYRSYTFHYQNAVSIIKVSSDDCVEFFTTDQPVMNIIAPGQGHREHIEEMGSVRLAMLDEKGNVLQVSRELILRTRHPFAILTGSFRYYARTDSFGISHSPTAAGFFYFLFAFCGLVFTCITEYLVAIPFGLWKWYGKTVVVVNIVSQLIMHSLYILLYGLLFWRYTASVLLLEVLVFAGECLYYSRKIDTEPIRKCILYGITANAVSLIVGLLIFQRFIIL